MVGSLFSREWVAELDRLQHDLQRSRNAPGTAQGAATAGFPAFNLRSTPQLVEWFALAPGLDPASIDVQLDGGLLTVAGQRTTGAPSDESDGELDASNAQPRAALRINERFSGAFRRTVGLPDDVDPDGVSADYRDGVLHIAVKRKEAVGPRRVAVTA